MNSKRFGFFTGKAAAALFAIMALMISGAVSASHFELTRLANQLDLVSSRLAYELRYKGSYSTVRSRAKSLSREAGQLYDALQRNRSSSSIRSHYRDVSRRFEKLEEAFLRANRRYYDAYAYQEVGLISQLFDGLSSEFYYAYYNEPRSGLSYYGSSRAYSYVPYSSRSYSPPRRSYSSPRRAYSAPPRVYSPRSRSPGNRVPQVQDRRQRDIPPVFRGDNRRTDGDRKQADRPRDRQGSSRRTQVPRDNFDQPSAVLDRQNRQNAERRRSENRTRNTDTAGSARNRADNRQPVAASQPRRGENRERRREPATENRRGNSNQANRSGTGPLSNSRRERIR